MARSTKHARIPYCPFAETLRYTRLDTLREETKRDHCSLVMDYQELVLDGAPQLVEYDGAPAEYLEGHYVPRRLRFSGVTLLQREGLYENLDSLPFDHSARCLQGMSHWYPPGKSEPLYLLGSGSTDSAGLLVSARHCTEEVRSGSQLRVEFTLPWSSPPPLPAGLVPAPQQLQSRYGGDPITIRLGKRLYHRRLFVGGLDYQTGTRPAVDSVLNLSEHPSRWSESRAAVQDRWSTKGEGAQGMSAAELGQEAQWVIERLRSGQRVLIHCSAGINRSVSICCATLIQLEGLTAEAALQRVRERHPWARPDQKHWLNLRWLARQR